MTVNLVIVSHSASLAEGTAELARQMGGDEVFVEPAGGMDDGSIGTDAERVRAAIERVRSVDGVLVLMDLGSALMSAEIALEMLEDGGPVALSAAPLVEGAVAAAARARGGDSLADVAAEARGALVMKTSQLEEHDAAPAAAAPEEAAGEAVVERLTVPNRLGLHVRPAGRIIELVTSHDATLELRNATRGTGPTDGRSLTGLALLRAAQGDELEVAARGPQASALLAALRALADDNFGDAPDAGAAATAVRPGGAASRRRHAAGMPPAGGRQARPHRAWRAPRGAARPPTCARRRFPATPLPRHGPAGRDRRARARARAGALDASGRGSTSTRSPPATTRARGSTPRCDATRAQLAAAAARVPGAEGEIFAAQALLLDDDAIVAPARGRDRGRRAGGARLPARERRGRRRLRRRRRCLPAGARDRRPRRRGPRAARARSAARRARPRSRGSSSPTSSRPARSPSSTRPSRTGIVTARGGTLDHAAIVAGALGIPLLVGVGPALLAVAEGATLAIDDGHGHGRAGRGHHGKRSSGAARRTPRRAPKR